MPLLNTSVLAPERAVIRQAVPGDLPRLVAAADEVFRSPRKVGLGSMGQDYPLLFAGDNAANLYVAEDPDQPSSSAGPGATGSAPPAIIGHTGFTLREGVLGGRRVKVACLGAVFTLPPYRNQGLATRLLRAAVDGARAGGADLGLVSGARGLYAAAGFDPFPRVRRYRIQRGPASRVAAAAGDLEVEPFSPAALADIARIHAGEPVRFIRSLDDWQRLLQARVLFFEPGTVFMVSRNRRMVAYLAVGRPFGEAGALPGARVLEVGGDREAIAAAAERLVDLLKVQALEVLLPPHDQSLEAVATRRGWSRDELTLPFSATWWNPACAGLPLPFYGLNYV